jgi:hypothetical protein
MTQDAVKALSDGERAGRTEGAGGKEKTGNDCEDQGNGTCGRRVGKYRGNERQANKEKQDKGRISRSAPPTCESAEPLIYHFFNTPLERAGSRFRYAEKSQSRCYRKPAALGGNAGPAGVENFPRQRLKLTRKVQQHYPVIVLL